MNYLTQLLSSVPPFLQPVAAFLLASVFMLLWYVVLYFLLNVLPSTRGLNFLLFDVDQVMARLFQPRPRRPRGTVSHSYRTDSKNRKLQRRLLILLKGDVAAGKRLLAQQRRRQPGQSDNWYLEKVIYDLERDRH
ncbi:hypothetical protein IQ243_09550 [Nostocales cyanobacterium LEGE 11386]|nr:hypothetical protein [Nostocales cyanobacterium LEGE 11386]